MGIWLLLVLTGLLGLCPSARGSGEECIVSRNLDYNTPFNEGILSFIASDRALRLYLWSSPSKDTYREVVLVCNAAAITYFEVKDGKANETTWHPFPVLLPEGWITLKLRVLEKSITLIWVTEKDPVTLVTLTTNSAAEKMSIKGFFSVCSGESPEWEVTDSDPAYIPLYLPDQKQNLIITPDDNATAFLVFQDSIADVVSNTNYLMTTKRVGSDYYIKIENEDSSGDGFNILQPPRSRPMVEVKSRRGSTHVLLKRAAGSETVTVEECLKIAEMLLLDFDTPPSPSTKSTPPPPQHTEKQEL